MRLIEPTLRTAEKTSVFPAAVRPPPRADRVAPPAVLDARPVLRLHEAAALLAFSALADSAVEHYRGSFANRAMYLPLAAASLCLASSFHGVTSPQPDSHPVRSLSYGAAIAVGALGTGFHIYNVGKRVGGFRWENLFYGAPLGAPAALALSGLVGLTGDRLAGNQRKGAATLLGLPAGRVVAVFASLGLVGSTLEAWLLHFRGNFHNPAMYLPVTLPPTAAAVTAHAALRSTRGRRRLARLWLGVTSLLGVLGVGFHCYGVSRAMGGWRNWRQNVVDGPPIPAPPSFSGLALAGLAALDLIESAER